MSCFFQLLKASLLAGLMLLFTPGFSPSAAVAQENQGKQIFVEAESFADLGGWKLDTQFIQQMGSPYLLAHGLGKPVGDAVTQIDVPAKGVYRVWVRTFDWVARWDASGHPGSFQLSIDGDLLPVTFGTQHKRWAWHDGGEVQLDPGKVELRLKDLTGFNGRCDCIYFTQDLDAQPPQPGGVMSSWRRKQLNLPAETRQVGPYDVVVVGGGYAGMGSAISAARMGCKVALIQDRGVLGGNGSSEVRVWAKGNIRRGEYSRIGEIIEEFADRATKSPGTYEEFGDSLKEQIVRAEDNIDLFLNQHAFDAIIKDQHIQSVDMLNTKTGEVVRVAGDRFVDCTGHGWLGVFVDADREMAEDGRMGMSNMWAWDEAKTAQAFPQTPWALDLKMQDFPYPRDHHGQWFWESGFDKDAVGDAEGIRDWNLRAVFGAFNAMKNRDGAADHRNAWLTWVAYVGGPRESNRLLGDVVLTQEDVVAKRQFPDGFVPSTWSIDLHYPKEQYAKSYPDNPFISKAVHDNRVDRTFGYPVPYRCFYSRNIDNLFMAGRNISVTHQALGTVRVMKTCGMMGEVVGKAASLCVQHDCSPREVYEKHLDELKELLRLPGKARRAKPGAPISIDPGALPEAPAYGPFTGRDPAKMKGIVVDDRNAQTAGKWSAGRTGGKYIGYSYRYASPNSGASAKYSIKVDQPGRYQVGVRSAPFDNRSTSAPIQVICGDQDVTKRINYQGTQDGEFVPVTIVNVAKGQSVQVLIQSAETKGLIHLDAVQLLAQ